MTENGSSRKRKADVLGRVAESNSQGRGADAGWTRCPLCGRHSQKKFALGRGISSHLHAVHTPWKPGKIELKKKRRLLERKRAEAKRTNGGRGLEQQQQEEADQEDRLTWEPTLQEKEAWAQKVLEIAAELEAGAKTPGLDRTGKPSKGYKDSLPTLLQHASNGDLEKLKQLIETAETDQDPEAVSTLLSIRDRNGSTAEHWAAGGGHLSCLKLLVNLRKQEKHEFDKGEPPAAKRVRRRDGKTSLHYAARNGHLDCIRHLLQQGGHKVDESSGDGTTPLHLACYGGHLKAVKLLMEEGGDPLATNAWGCGAVHWAGMTKCKNTETVRALLQLLQKAGVPFAMAQKQGHSVLHKAAQKNNAHVIEWMAQPKDQGGAGLSLEEKIQVGQPDQGNHKPSDIWESVCVGGERSFADWMRDEHGW